MPVKSKLLNLREWLTVPEAARYLSNIFEEEISESDLLRISLGGHLKLSVYFVNYANARRWEVVSYEDAKWEESTLATFFMSEKHLPDNVKGNPQKTREFIDQLPPTMVMKSLNLDDERYLTLDENVTTIGGVWDLPMIGGERLDIEHKYQMLTDGPEVTLEVMDGAFVESKDGQTMCQLQQSFEQNEYQSGSKAQLEKIKEHIAINNIGEEQAKELIDQHKKNREE